MIFFAEPPKNSSSASAWLASPILPAMHFACVLVSLRFFFELLLERFAERLAVVVGEAFDLVELPVAVFFDQGDFEGLRAERAAFEFDLARSPFRRSTETFETLALFRLFFPAFGFLFAGFDRRLALFAWCSVR